MIKTLSTITFLFFLACNQPESGAEGGQYESAGKAADASGAEVVNKAENKDAIEAEEKRGEPSKGNDQKRKNNPGGRKMFRGAISNGMKGDSISFIISEDGRKLEELTFKGYWRCSGRLESIIAGPEGSFNVVNGKVDDHISEPPDGGSTAWRFQLKTELENERAVGEFRMNINNLGCDTYLLKFEATADH